MALLASPTHLIAVHFDIVGSCQLRCVGCPNSTILNNVTRIAPDMFAACLRNIDVESVDVFRFFNYGEPLLHTDLPAIFDAFERERSFSVDEAELSTNAQFVRWDQLEEVLSRRILRRLVVSCDGDGTPESYQDMRPPATWAKLIEFLTKARELRDAVAPNLELMTRSVVRCKDDMDRWRSVLTPLGWVPEFRPWFNLVGGAENRSGRDFEPASGLCGFVSAPTLYVDADGSVVPCCAHPRAGFLGSLAKTPFSEIYTGIRRQRFESALQNDRANMNICKSCEFGADTDPAKHALAADL